MSRLYTDRTSMADRSGAGVKRPSNPADDLSARILIYGIQLGTVSNAVLKQIFGSYGKILEQDVLRGCAYVQYDSPSSAQLAMQNENGKSYKGCKLDIKLAAQKQWGSSESDHDGDAKRRRITQLGSNAELLATVRDSLIQSVNSASSRAQTSGGQTLTTGQSMISSPADPVVCQIVIRDPETRQYAEIIQKQLNNKGVHTQILLLPLGCDVTRTLADITLKYLYGVIISDQNVMHASASVLIFHGEPQEHRNMPVEDAIKLLVDNYRKYLHANPRKSATPSFDESRASSKSVARPPSPSASGRGDKGGFSKPSTMVCDLLDDLKEGRFVTLRQLDVLTDFIEKRRKEIVGGDPGSPNASVTSTGGLDETVLEAKKDLKDLIYKVLKGELTAEQSGLPLDILNPALSAFPSLAQKSQGKNSSADNKSSASTNTADKKMVFKSFEGLFQANHDRAAERYDGSGPQTNEFNPLQQTMRPANPMDQMVRPLMPYGLEVPRGPRPLLEMTIEQPGLRSPFRPRFEGAPNQGQQFPPRPHPPLEPRIMPLFRGPVPNLQQIPSGEPPRAGLQRPPGLLSLPRDSLLGTRPHFLGDNRPPLIQQVPFQRPNF